jgi:uncharacterized membrane protein
MKITPLLLSLFLVATTLTAHAQTHYRVTRVGDRPVAGYALNDKAEVAGSYGTETSIGRPYVWRNGVTVELPWANTQPGEYSEAMDINDRSELVGFSSDSIAGRFEGSIWRNDQYHELEGFAPSDFVQAMAINNLGEVIALRNDEYVVWKNGHYWQLPPLQPGGSIQLQRLNDLGFVVGTVTPLTPLPGQGQRAVMWVFGFPVDLGTLPGTYSSTAYAINNRAQVVGTSSTRAPFATLPWLWENGHLIPLPTLRGAEGYSSIPGRISDHGVIVGISARSGDSGASRIATVWQDGVVTAVDDLIRANDPFKPYLHFEASIDVNTRGQILAYAHDSRDGTEASPKLFLLTPVR